VQYYRAESFGLDSEQLRAIERLSAWLLISMTLDVRPTADKDYS
jgi:hypothetical protein